MLKKCLIALVLVALSSAPVFAHPTWGYGVTTSVSWEWATKPGCTVDVKMKIVMWADLYCTGPLVIHQVDGDLFAGCVDVKLCVNFSGIKIDIQYVEIIDIADADKDKDYRIALDDKGTGPNFGDWSPAPSDSMHVTDVHLSNNLRLLTICLEVRNVDPQRMAYDPQMALVKIGEIVTTLTPTLAPPGQPANGIIDTDYFPPVIP